MQRDFCGEGETWREKFIWLMGGGLTDKDKGGLGLRKLALLNKALLSKWIWRYACDKDNLWRQVIKVKYGQEGLDWRPKKAMGREGQHDQLLDRCVVLRIPLSQCFLISLGFQTFLEEDSVLWRKGRSGQFRVKEAYSLLTKSDDIGFPYKSIWVARVPTKLPFLRGRRHGEGTVKEVLASWRGSFCGKERKKIWDAIPLSHCIDLILEDIEKLPTIKRTLTRAITLNGFIYNHVGDGSSVKVLQLVDNERKPAMGYIYKAMDRCKETIKKSFNEDEDKYKEIFSIIDKRWECQLHHRPLHAVDRLVSDIDVQDKIIRELSTYKNAEGLFGIPIAIRSRKMLAPGRYDRCNVIDPISLVDIDESNEWLIGKISEEDTTIHAEDDLVFEDDSLTWGVVASALGVGDANISTRLRPRSKTSLKGDLVAATSQPDFEEKESNLEDIEEDDNEMEGYQSSLDESDDNFNFNDDYNGDA
ncbi:hypothetical protein CK203_043838 [Vitis vinifera]|uniref:Uncharacterized protein n=1 Tax=Vitis vinifera TaxID=29760 RepID=A0A438HVM0_VITVI|nr:hypothetical protein CK203_043838 [Vitis vinifera]